MAACTTCLGAARVCVQRSALQAALCPHLVQHRGAAWQQPSVLIGVDRQALEGPVAVDGKVWFQVLRLQLLHALRWAIQLEAVELTLPRDVHSFCGPELHGPIYHHSVNLNGYVAALQPSRQLQ
jgi:hypothetical protein